MAIGARSHGILLKVPPATNAPVDGGWWEVERNIGDNNAAKDLIVVSIPAGVTPTVIVEGRNDPGDTPVVVSTGGVAVAVASEQYRQYRARLSAGTGVTAQVTINRSLVSTT